MLRDLSEALPLVLISTTFQTMNGWPEDLESSIYVVSSGPNDSPKPGRSGAVYVALGALSTARFTGFGPAL